MTLNFHKHPDYLQKPMLKSLLKRALVLILSLYNSWCYTLFWSLNFLLFKLCYFSFHLLDSIFAHFQFFIQLTDFFANLLTSSTYRSCSSLLDFSPCNADKDKIPGYWITCLNYRQKFAQNNTENEYPEFLYEWKFWLIETCNMIFTPKIY